MPLYEYVCDACGVFSAMNSMVASHESKDCPDCGAESQRILSPPQLAILTRSDRVAHERNEKSAYAPMTGKASSCGCSGSHTCKSDSNEVKQKPKSPSGLQMQTKKTARPWMLAH